MSEPLNDDERKSLYGSLLRGIANECQDRLCAADKQHVWGQWVNYVVQPDYRPAPVVSAEPVSKDETYRVASRRVCLNCGKEQFSS